MAQITSSLGFFEGRIGTVTFYRDAEGRNLCRSLAHHRKGSLPRQKAWEKRFAAVIHALPYLMKAIQTGFPGKKGSLKGFHGFVKANIKQAVRQDESCPEGKLDFERLQLSAGDVTPPDLQGEWQADRKQAVFAHKGCPLECYHALADDRLYAVVVDESLSFCELLFLGIRAEDFYKELEVREADPSSRIHLYAFATTADGLQASPTVLLR